MSWLRPAGTLPGECGPVALDPTAAGWEYCGLRVVAAAAGSTTAIDLAGTEAAVVPLSGRCTIAVAGAGRFELAGRASVFAAVADVVYLPAGTRCALETATGGEFAIATAVADAPGDVIHRPAADIPIEVRGAGQATRQVNALLPAEVAGPQRLIVVEVLTPAGNWSSYPPHKHDEATADESPLEEIYYFRVAGNRGLGLHRTYTADGTVDETVTVADGDVYLVPYGYHGPCVAAPGYDLYYLNVMAGPERRWSISFDPDHRWVMDTWRDQTPDPRIPMTGSS
ncbi:MAG: 5-deoxy-glucuronate isomerase [Acidimicrobiia bacterium]|nr:5-deoxy-glucuronate isomerase [Acidimicrobiia bacterium]